MPHSESKVKTSGYPKREFSKALPEPTLCPNCHAVYMSKRWMLDEKLYKKEANDHPNKELCPGCQKVHDQSYDGIVHLQSPLLKSRKADLENLIKREEEKEREKNVLSRIGKIESRDGEMDIYTTTQFMASRLGHAINKAFAGELTIKPTPQESFLRVYWNRLA